MNRLENVEYTTEHDIYTDSLGIKYFYRSGTLKFDDSVHQFMIGGILHRDNDLPAIVYPNGSAKWFKEHKLHRDNDQPAIVFEDGSQFWFTDGKKTRSNGLPAVLWADGDVEYWLDNKLHNPEGPACTRDSKKEYYIDGQPIKEKDFLEKQKQI